MAKLALLCHFAGVSPSLSPEGLSESEKSGKCHSKLVPFLVEVGCRDQGKVRAAEIRNRQLLIIHASENRETKFSWK